MCNCQSDTIKKARTQSKPLKEDKRYRDAPRFKATYGYEDNFKNGFSKLLLPMQKELIRKMVDMKPKK